MADAYLIKGEVYCNADDQESAQAMARKIHGGAHARLVAYCAKKSISLQ